MFTVSLTRGTRGTFAKLGDTQSTAPATSDIEPNQSIHNSILQLNWYRTCPRSRLTAYLQRFEEVLGGEGRRSVWKSSSMAETKRRRRVGCGTVARRSCKVSGVRPLEETWKPAPGGAPPWRHAVAILAEEGLVWRNKNSRGVSRKIWFVCTKSDNSDFLCLRTFQFRIQTPGSFCIQISSWLLYKFLMDT
jgi:hypothetical protein